MENFIVSARKYRPVTFDSVVGQKSITNTLKNAIRNGQLAQAFLFCGPRGVGKTTCARILAKTINCQNRSENIEPCNKCESCLSFNNNASFNIHELDAASNNSVEDIRSLVDQVRIPPQVGDYKVYIIDEVHMLSSSAFNAFLKTLEEPPSYAKFILATTEKHKIIPTILSRCQIFDFRRITTEDIAEHLAYVAQQENITYEDNALHIIAQKADGAMRDALSMFDQIASYSGNNITYENVIENLNILDYEYYFKLVDIVLNNDIPGSLMLLNEIIENGFDGQQFLIGLGEHLRNLLVCKDQQTLGLLEVSKDFQSRYSEQASKCKQGFLIDALKTANHCDLYYKGSNNKRMFLELSLIEIIKLSDINPADTEKKKPEPGVKEEKKNAVNKTLTEENNKAQSVTPVVSEKPKPKAEFKLENLSKTRPDKTPETHISYNNTAKPESNIKVKSTSTISIKDAVNGKIKKEEEIEDEDDSLKPKTDFKEESMQEIWENFASGIREKNPSYSVSLISSKPELKDNFRILFKTDNKILINDKVFLAGLLSNLKTNLKNWSITIETQLTKIEKNKKAYTDKEKFELLAKKNPSLIKLKKDLDLELEF